MDRERVLWCNYSPNVIVASVMPLHWNIDPDKKLVTAVAEGDVTRVEFDAFLDDMSRAGADTYRKLFDGGRGDTHMEAEDILALGARMRASHERGPVGPLAVVVPRDHVDTIGRVLGMLAAAERPMRVFRQVGPARKWISNQPG
jgi:hypothetical protein